MRRKRRSGLRHDGGASTAEYGAILLLVAALAAVFTVVALPDRVKTSTAAAICQLFSGIGPRDCPEDDPPAPAADDPPGDNAPPEGDDPALPDPGPQGQPPAADPNLPQDPALDPDDPDVQNYNNAKNEADDAGQALTDLNNQLGGIKQEIIDLLKDVVGITDIENCLTKGDIVSCLSALSGLVPWGKVLKVLKKIPGAIKLAKKIKELWDKLADARNRKKKADDALEDARKKLEDKGVCPIDPPNSFVAGTRVLLADGSHKPIEQIRVGDLVWAADPVRDVRGPRKVTRLITGQGVKRLVVLTAGHFGRLGPTVTATADHPFWNPGLRGWQAAGRLTLGTHLSTPEGRAVLADSRPRTATARVHNLTVSGLHTYYVLVGDTPVLVHNDDCRKPANLPAWKKIDIDIDHILDRHTANGKTYKQSGIKTKFPDEMSRDQIESTVRQAYRNSTMAGPSQGDRVKLRGKANGLTIEMWVNKKTRQIETAYPVWD